MLLNSITNITIKTLKNLWYIIANSNGVVATRFHSIILSFLFNKPCLPFIYHEKTTDIVRKIWNLEDIKLSSMN